MRRRKDTLTPAREATPEGRTNADGATWWGMRTKYQGTIRRPAPRAPGYSGRGEPIDRSRLPARSLEMPTSRAGR